MQDVQAYDVHLVADHTNAKTLYAYHLALILGRTGKPFNENFAIAGTLW